MATLIDQHGNPLRTADIAEPQTARIAVLEHQTLHSQLDGITPARAAQILRNADQGDLVAQSQLFDDMLDRDAHLRSEWEKRTGAPLTLDWRVVPPRNPSAAEKACAEWVEEILRDVVDDFDDVLLAMMEAPGYGFSAIEIEWRRDGGEWLPSFHPRPQTWFQMDTRRRSLRLRDGSADGAEMISMGWILHTARKVKTGYQGRAGILRPAVWPFLYKAYSIGDFAEFLETYGLPIIVGKYISGATDEEKASLMRAVAALGHDARAIMPEGMALEIQKITGGGEGSHHLNMVDWADRAHSKLVLGQVLSAEAKATGLGSGVADLQGAVRDDILAGDARQLASTLTRDLVYPLLSLNRGGIDSMRRCPRLEFDLNEAEDLQSYAEALPALAAGGARIPVSWVHEKLRIPQAAEGEPVFGAVTPSQPAPAAALSARPVAALSGTAVQPTDGIDGLVDAALNDWAPVMSPLVDPIQAEMDASAAAGETAEQLIARLPAVLSRMDPTALVAALARVAGAAHLAGRAGLERDDG
jgi:phage gp29-like protein